LKMVDLPTLGSPTMPHWMPIGEGKVACAALGFYGGDGSPPASAFPCAELCSLSRNGLASPLSGAVAPDPSFAPAARPLSFLHLRCGSFTGPARPCDPARGFARPPIGRTPDGNPVGLLPWTPRLRGGHPSPTPQRQSGSRGKVGGSSWSTRPPARRCAVAAGGLMPSGQGSGALDSPLILRSPMGVSKGGRASGD